MKFNKTTVVLTILTLCFTALAYSWPATCPGGYFRLWQNMTTAPYYPSSWYSHHNRACRSDGELSGIGHTVGIKTSFWSFAGYTWVFRCCANIR